MAEFPKGSEWRRWDLHVHTPETVFNNQFGNDWEEYLQAIEAEEYVKVIGVTDYFLIENYSRLKKFHEEDNRIKNVELILPNIEFRLAHKGKSGDVNIHLLIDPTDPSHEEKIDNALARLSFDNTSCTRRQLINWGRHQLNGGGNTQTASEKQALEEACKRFRPSYTDFLDWWKKEQWLSSNSLLALPGGENGVSEYMSGDGSWDSVYEIILKEIGIIFSGRPGDIEFWLGQRQSGDIGELEKIGGFKPCIHGSDAHSVSKLFKPDENRFCWIKADPTFEGLKQITREPKKRVFIGELPDKLTLDKNNPTKIIDKIKIGSVEGRQGWFDCELQLNSGLVAIIGNKGSGKSALADILALAGNSHCPKENYSFLTEKKFDKEALSSRFCAKLDWLDGTQNCVRLSEECKKNTPQKVIYIPQSRLEAICAETNHAEFQDELHRVIFLRLDGTKKADYQRLQDLLDAQSTARQNKISALRRQISDINKGILESEKFLSPEFSEEIKNQLEEKKRELRAHEDSQPEQVSEPASSDEATQEQRKLPSEIGNIRRSMSEAQSTLVEETASLTETRKHITIANNLLQEVQNYKDSFDRFKERDKKQFDQIGISLEDTISLKIDLRPLQNKLSELARQETESEQNVQHILPNQVTKFTERLTKLQAKIDEPNQKYQAYLQDLAAWENRRLEIEGDADAPASGTINYLNKWQKYIADGCPEKLESDKQSRNKLVTDILTEMHDMISEQKNLYKPIEKLISENQIIKDKIQFGIESKIIERGFSDKFFEHLNQGAAGNFYGLSEGRDVLEQLKNDISFSDKDELLKFLSRLDEYLHKDKRDGKGEDERLKISSQLRKDYEPIDLYNFIWSLEYLKPELSLSLAKKPMEQLSPGERGTILLVFYLLLDDSGIPIIIDQPEENLDNQTVFEILAPIINEAKERRQVIMVTHNPNIAVACDAEQIIHASIDKESNNTVTYRTGAIEDTGINRALLDVLEGTAPAFDNRKQKYIEN